MARLLVLVVLAFVGLPSIKSVELQNYTICCDFCRGDQDLWTTVHQRWNLTIGDAEVTDFHTPAAFLPEESRHAVSTVFGRDYLLHYSGAPVYLKYQSFLDSAAILDEQYVELDLQEVHDIVGINVQGGFYRDTEDDLFPRRDVWVKEMLVSYSTTRSGYTWIKTSVGTIQRFPGTTDSSMTRILGFTAPVQARYVRVHPLAAGDAEGATQHALLRASPVTCSMDSMCMLPRANCVLNEWQGWGECTCTDSGGCVHTRKRSVARYEACGGTTCPPTSEWFECQPVEPMWKTYAMWGGIGAALLLVLLIVIIVPVMLHKKKEKPEVFVNRNREPKATSAAPLREMRKDLKTKNNLEEIDDETANDLADKQLIPAGNTGAAVVAEGSKKEKKPKKEKKSKKTKKNDDKTKDDDLDKEKNKKKVTWNENELERTKSHESLGEDQLDGMYMVKRDEMVSNSAPKPVGPRDVAQVLDPITPRQVDVVDVKTPRVVLPPPRGAPSKELPPIGGPSSDPFGARSLPPVRNSAALNDFGDDDEMAILDSIGPKSTSKPKPVINNAFDDDDFEKEFAEFL